MGRSQILIFILFFFISSFLQAHETAERPVSNIIIIGNKQTKNEVIERELLFKRGQTVNDSLLIESKHRLENLWLFNRVEFFPMDNGDSLSLLISVTERLYLLPFPEYKVEDRDWNKLTYGIGLANDNLRGMNEKLYLSAQFGYRPGYKAAYYNPWIGGDLHLTGSLFIQKFSLPNRQQSFDENHLYLALSSGKYWTRHLYSRLIFYRDKIQVNKASAQFMESASQTDINYGIFVINAYDTRDLRAYPQKGVFAQMQIQESGLFSDDIHYAKFDVDMRGYFPWKKLIFASRFFSRFSQGRLPIYDGIYLGYNNRIRGHFSEIYRGKYLTMGGAALRFPLMKVRYFSFPSVLAPANATRNMKFGINGGLFAESGVIWNKQEDLKTKNFISGFGFGLHFLLPYIEVLRLDMAFNEKLEHEIIIEIQMPF